MIYLYKTNTYTYTTPNLMGKLGYHSNNIKLWYVVFLYVLCYSVSTDKITLMLYLWRNLELKCKSYSVLAFLSKKQAMSQVFLI